MARHVVYTDGTEVRFCNGPCILNLIFVKIYFNSKIIKYLNTELTYFNMTVVELERIAKESHNGEIRVENKREYKLELSEREGVMGISVIKRRDEIKRFYPDGPIILKNFIKTKK